MIDRKGATMAKWRLHGPRTALDDAIDAMESALNILVESHYGDGNKAVDQCFDASEILSAALRKIKGEPK